MKTVLIITAVLASAACRSEPKAKPLLIGWRPIQTFSGHGNAQTDSFDIGSLQWRMKWATRNENPPGTGTFILTVHSAISGRPLGAPVENRGNGHGIAYINEDPRLYDLVIESSGVDWSVSVEESVLGREQSFRGYDQGAEPRANQGRLLLASDNVLLTVQRLCHPVVENGGSVPKPLGFVAYTPGLTAGGYGGAVSRTNPGR